MTDLNICMPRDSLIVDLWDWDIHFERELSLDWCLEAAFGGQDSVPSCAEDLADFFLEKVTEYGMDYDQQADTIAFESFVRNESLNFILVWRMALIATYGSPDPVNGDT